MSSRSRKATRRVLRAWGLPKPGDSKKARGRILVVGGSDRSPGAVLLAGEAALRVGAGRLGLVAPSSLGPQLGVALPEAGIQALPHPAAGSLGSQLREELAAADAVLLGPGFADADETLAVLRLVAAARPSRLVLDAYGLGVLPRMERQLLPATLLLNPNAEEAAILLGRELGRDRAADVQEIAQRYDAVVNCYGIIAAPRGTVWQVGAGGPGLGTSGSGDVLAGAIAGFAARGMDPLRAAVWGSWTHARAGDRLTARAGLGFLARDLPFELTLAMKEITG